MGKAYGRCPACPLAACGRHLRQESRHSHCPCAVDGVVGTGAAPSSELIGYGHRWPCCLAVTPN